MISNWKFLQKLGFAGHPPGLATLFGSEMWERFSYYGMRALLVLYMVEFLFTPERMAAAHGLSALRSGLEALSGPLAAQAFASQIYGLYTGLVYLTPILGGLLADRWLGRSRTIVLGASLMALGHFLMSFERLFLIALLCIAFGCGAFKPNISTQVGELYGRDDPRRDRAYSIFYVGINIGAFFAPLVCGTLGERWGWPYGFAAAGVGMAIGLATYLMGRAHLPDGRPAEDIAPVSAVDSRRAYLCVALLFLPSALFWAAFEQQGNTIALWAADFTDRRVDLFGGRFEIPVTWFQAFNPAFIFLFTPPLVAYWGRLSAQGREPSTLRKLTIGCVGVAASYGLMALAASTNAGGKASWLWLVAFFVLVTISELHFSPITLSLVSRVAPAGARSGVMGAWFASMFAGNVLAGFIGGYWSTTPAPWFFTLVATLGLAAAFCVEAVKETLRRATP